MESLNWKPFLVVASAALTAMGSTASAQIANSPVQQVKASTADDGNLFDSRLVAQNGSCNPLGGPCVPNGQGMPYPSTATPGTTPMPPETPASPQPITPDNVFNNQPNNSLANNDAMNNLNALGAGQGALTAQSNIASMMVGGYLDPAAPMTTFRLRYDNAVNNLYPDRGEYIYAQCGCFRSAALAGPLQNPSARGPQGVEQSVSIQEVKPYFELAFNNRLSVFAEVPVRFVDFHSIPSIPDPNQQGLGNEGGLGDVNAGFKYALIADPNRYVTFQLRTYIPTGDSYLGLGTGHVSIEPSLLFYQRLSTKWIFQGQLTEWTPINVSSFASEVLQYGGGLGYILYQGQNTQVTPLLETVGWTFIGGKKFNATDGGLQSASGDTIVNIKPGVRIGWGGNSGYMTQQNQSLYVGFGIPITDQQFYNNLFRAEYRIIF